MNLIRARRLEKLSLSIKVVFILVLSTCQLFFSNTVFSSGRPEGITINSAWVGYDLKSGEELPLTDHGWAFSHLRELLPTVDIPIEPQHVIPLRGSPVHPSKINLTLKGKKLNLDDLKLARNEYLVVIFHLYNNPIEVELGLINSVPPMSPIKLLPPTNKPNSCICELEKFNENIKIIQHKNLFI